MVTSHLPVLQHLCWLLVASRSNVSPKKIRTGITEGMEVIWRVPVLTVMPVLWNILLRDVYPAYSFQFFRKKGRGKLILAACDLV